MMKTKCLLYTAVLSIALLMLATSCKKNDITSETPSDVIPVEETVTDIDGNVYHTVTIGKQVWMKENLKVTRYRNGDSIPYVSDNAEWFKLTTGAYCNYNNKPGLGATYGSLYNWYAVHDNRNLAPAGWHVSSDAEWTVFAKCIDSIYNNNGYSSGKAIAFTSGWEELSTVGCIGYDQASNNKSGFSALPGGFRDELGYFSSITHLTGWWSATQTDSLHVNVPRIQSITANLLTINVFKRDGLPIRCVKD